VWPTYFPRGAIQILIIKNPKPGSVDIARDMLGLRPELFLDSVLAVDFSEPTL
jgi:hypothetical protein